MQQFKIFIISLLLCVCHSAMAISKYGDSITFMASDNIKNLHASLADIADSAKNTRSNVSSAIVNKDHEGQGNGGGVNHAVQHVDEKLPRSDEQNITVVTMDDNYMARRSNNAIATLVNFSRINVVSSRTSHYDEIKIESAQKQATTPNASDIVLNTIIYIDKKQWRLWIGSNMYDDANREVGDQFKIVAVGADYAILMFTSKEEDIKTIESNISKNLNNIDQVLLFEYNGKKSVLVKIKIGQLFRRSECLVLDFYR